MSILRLLGKFYGFYPEDPVAAWRVDSVIDAAADLQDAFWDLMNASHNKESETKTEKMLEKYLRKTLNIYLRVMQQRLAANGNPRHLVGDKVTLADFITAHCAYTYFMNEHNQYYKEQQEVINREDFKDIKAYLVNLKEDVLKE